MDLLIVFGAGIAISFFSSFTSGGLAVLSLAFLLATGLPAHMALGTFRLGGLGHAIGGVTQYIKANKVVWNLILPITAFSLLGSLVGAQLVLSVDEGLLERIIGFAILIFIPISIWKPQLGVENRLVTFKERIRGHIATFFISIWGGSISIGTGIMILYAHMHYYGRTILEVRGTNRIPNFIKTIGVLAVFAYHGLVNWQVGLAFGAGMLIGAFFGVKYAIRLGDSWMRYILLATVAIFSIKLILGL